jgi:hypothetical protein
MVGMSKLYARCRQTKKNKLQKFTKLREVQAQETLVGLAYNEKKSRRRWVMITPTCKIDLWLVDAPNGL